MKFVYYAEVCPACCNLRVRFRAIPVCEDEVELEEYPCPICCQSQYPNGFQGEQQGDEWVIPPYAPGGVPIYKGLKMGIRQENPGV